MGTLRRNGVPAADDPVDEAVRNSKKVLAVKMMQQSVSQMESDALESENNRLRAEIERKKLEEEARGPARSEEADSWREYLMGELKELRTALAESERARTEQDRAAMMERLSMLSHELERIQAEKPEPPNLVAQMRQAVDEAESLLSIIRPKSDEAPAPARPDPQVEAWKHKETLAHQRYLADLEQRRLEREEEKEARTLERTDKLQIERERLSIERTHYERLDRFISDTAPKLIDVGLQFVQTFMAGRLQVTPPAGVPQVSPQAAPGLPPGAESQPCTQCGFPLVYASTATLVRCNNCGAEFNMTGEEPPPGPEPEAPETTAPLTRRGTGIH